MAWASKENEVSCLPCASTEPSAAALRSQAEACRQASYAFWASLSFASKARIDELVLFQGVVFVDGGFQWIPKP
eukprot:Skav227101  [mRNA]  locus=scaffold199:106074:112733:+ [translate_table: standard]